MGTALPRRVRPYVSRRARDAPVPDRLEATGMSAPAAQPLGTSPVPTRPDPTRGGSLCPGVPAGFGRPALCGVQGSRTRGRQPLGLPLRRHRVVPGAGSEETGARPHCGCTPREKGRARDRNAKRGLGLVAETLARTGTWGDSQPAASSPHFHKRRRHFGCELPGWCAGVGSPTPRW